MVSVIMKLIVFVKTLQHMIKLIKMTVKMKIIITVEIMFGESIITWKNIL